MNALELADKLEQDPSEWGGLGKVAWPAAAMLRNLHTENTALRCTEMALRDEVAELEQQLESVRKDAERYRWLRDVTCDLPDNVPVVAARTPDDVVCLVGHEIDDAIDAAMKEQK